MRVSLTRCEKRYYDEKKKEGICVTCNKKAVIGRVRCEKHIRKGNKSSRQYYRNMKTKSFQDVVQNHKTRR